jgi:hypothetical protein
MGPLEVAAAAGTMPESDTRDVMRITQAYLEVRYASRAEGRDDLLRDLKRFRPGSNR